jgi:hypothetical protein
MHDNVNSGEPARQCRVAYIDYAPCHSGHIAAVIVYRDDAANLGRLGKPRGQRQAEAARRTSNRDHRPGLPADQARQVGFWLADSGRLLRLRHALLLVHPVIGAAHVLVPGRPLLGFAARTALMANLGYSVAHSAPLLG